VNRTPVAQSLRRHPTVGRARRGPRWLAPARDELNHPRRLGQENGSWHLFLSGKLMGHRWDWCSNVLFWKTTRHSDIPAMFPPTPITPR